MVIFMPSGVEESISNLCFLHVVPLTVCFCIFKETGQSERLVHFLCLTCHIVARHFLAKCSIPTLVCLLWTGHQ